MPLVSDLGQQLGQLPTECFASRARPVSRFTASVEADLAFGTIGIAYELPVDRDFAWELYLAARWWHLRTTVGLVPILPLPPVSGSLQRNWADAVVGTRLRYRITDRWRVTALADVGAGGSSLTWKIYAGGGYDFNRHVGLTFGYRILGVDYKQRGMVFDIVQHGLVVGVRMGF